MPLIRDLSFGSNPDFRVVDVSKRYRVKRRQVSESRACPLVGQQRSMQRYERVAPAYEMRLVKRMNEPAAAHSRYGYRRIWALLGRGLSRQFRKRIERV